MRHLILNKYLLKLNTHTHATAAFGCSRVKQMNKINGKCLRRKKLIRKICSKMCSGLELVNIEKMDNWVKFHENRLQVDPVSLERVGCYASADEILCEIMWKFMKIHENSWNCPDRPPEIQNFLLPILPFYKVFFKSGQLGQNGQFY